MEKQRSKQESVDLLNGVTWVQDIDYLNYANCIPYWNDYKFVKKLYLKRERDFYTNQDSGLMIYSDFNWEMNISFIEASFVISQIESPSM